MELVWFKGVDWILKKLQPGVEYVVFGRPTAFGRKINMAHPEIEVLTSFNVQSGYLQPVYSTTEKLKKKYLDSKALGKIIKTLLDMASPRLRETLPPSTLDEYRLISKQQAVRQIHLPDNHEWLQKARFD